MWWNVGCEGVSMPAWVCGGMLRGSSLQGVWRNVEECLEMWWNVKKPSSPWGGILGNVKECEEHWGM